MGLKYAVRRSKRLWLRREKFRDKRESSVTTRREVLKYAGLGLGAAAPANAEFLPPTTVKGRSQLVAAWRVGAVGVGVGTVDASGGES